MSIKGLVDYGQPLVAAATVLGIGFLASVAIGAYTAYQVKTAGDTVEVTGSAKASVVADFARWTINLDTKTPINDQQSGFTRLDGAVATITAYLARQGFTDIETPAPSVNPDYTYPQNGAPIHTGYTVARQIVVRSADIEKISALAGNIAPLTGPSYNVTTYGLELTYSKLPDMRVALLADAIKDAKARAESIASETGRSVGALRAATGGVVQVLPQGGVDISDYGSYDTQSLHKDIMITVRANFSLR